MAELHEEHRVLWIKTILALSGRETRRREFINGYNGFKPSSRASAEMKDAAALGYKVYLLLREQA